LPAGRGEATSGSMTVKVTARGAERWKQGHPWIYRSDVAEEPDKKPGIVPVTDRRGKFLGQALYSPSSEIRLRLLTRGNESIDAPLGLRPSSGSCGGCRGWPEVPRGTLVTPENGCVSRPA